MENAVCGDTDRGDFSRILVEPSVRIGLAGDGAGGRLDTIKDLSGFENLTGLEMQKPRDSGWDRT